VAAATAVKPAPGPRGETDRALEFDGRQDRVLYALEEFPEEDYSVALWVKVMDLPEGRLGQVCSAWTAGMDDPLRVCVQHGRLFARIEAGQAYSTEGVSRPGQPVVARGRGEVRNHAHALVERRSQVERYGARTHPQRRARPRPRGNPHFGGNEFLAAQLAEFACYRRALSGEEIQRLRAAAGQ